MEKPLSRHIGLAFLAGGVLVVLLTLVHAPRIFDIPRLLQMITTALGAIVFSLTGIGLIQASR